MGHSSVSSCLSMHSYLSTASHVSLASVASAHGTALPPSASPTNGDSVELPQGFEFVEIDARHHEHDRRLVSCQDPLRMSSGKALACLGSGRHQRGQGRNSRAVSLREGAQASALVRVGHSAAPPTLDLAAGATRWRSPSRVAGHSPGGPESCWGHSERTWLMLARGLRIPWRKASDHRGWTELRVTTMCRGEAPSSSRLQQHRRPNGSAAGVSTRWLCHGSDHCAAATRRR